MVIVIARSDDLVHIKEKMFDMHLGGENKVEWLPAHNKQYNCKESWNYICVKKSVVSVAEAGLVSKTHS